MNQKKSEHINVYRHGESYRNVASHTLRWMMYGFHEPQPRLSVFPLQAAESADTQDPQGYLSSSSNDSNAFKCHLLPQLILLSCITKIFPLLHVRVFVGMCRGEQAEDSLLKASWQPRYEVTSEEQMSCQPPFPTNNWQPFHMNDHLTSTQDVSSSIETRSAFGRFHPTSSLHNWPSRSHQALRGGLTAQPTADG